MSNEYVIRFAGLAGIHTGPGAVPEPGVYLAEYDPDGNGGMGSVTWTTDWHEALLFETGTAAFTFWRQQSTVLPIRGDGKPNRPLTACSIEVVKLAQAMTEPWGIRGPNVRTN